jgi:hypothetical protein
MSCDPIVLVRVLQPFLLRGTAHLDEDVEVPVAPLEAADLIHQGKAALASEADEAVVREAREAEQRRVCALLADRAASASPWRRVA